MFSSLKFLNALAPWQWALAAAVPAGILALYFLRLRRKALVVPSTFLWKKSIEDLHVNSFWQRLRKNILLLLQLLVAAAALFALGHPTVNAAEEGKYYILAIDNSASMSTVENGKSRLDLAKEKALEFLDTLGPGDSAMALAFNETARVLCSYTNNKNAVRRAVASVEATAKRTNLVEAFNIASGLANPVISGGDITKQEIFAEAQPATMYVYSDGRFPKLPSVTLGRLEMRYRQVGQATNNVGLVSVSARRLIGEGNRVEIFGLARNFGAEAVKTTAALLVDGASVDLQQVDLPAGGEQGVLFRLQLGDTALLQLRLDAQDALPLDNSAWAVIEPARKARVAVVGDDNPILKVAFATKGLAEIAEVDFLAKSLADSDLTEDKRFQKYDLTVFDGCTPKGMPPCNCWMIGSLPPAAAAAALTNVKVPAILNWNVEHPAMRFLALDDVFIADAFVMTEPKGATPLLETDRGAVMLTMSRGVFTDLIQTFRILDDGGNPVTDWPGKPSFPLFIMNLVTALSGVDREGKQSLAPGEPVTFRGNEKATTCSVKTPTGAVKSVKPSKTGAFEFLDTDELGVYEAAFGDVKRRFSVNLFDADESNVKPEETIGVGQEQVAAETAISIRRRELWKWLAAAALALVLFEWYVYNRRVQL